MVPMNISGSGGGGGKSGSSGGVSENPNTLSSIALVQLVEAIGEGEIVGLVNGEYSIYLDGVALRDLSGTPNYKPFQWAARYGTQTQTVINGFSGTQQLTDVSTKITVSAGPIIRSVPDQYASAVRVTMTFPALTSTTDKGEIQGTTVQYKVGVRKVGGAFTYTPIQTVQGKSTAEYQETVEVSLSDLGPSASGYEVQVTRITADSGSALLANDSYWADYVIVHYEKFTYPNTALIAMQLDSRYFSQVPTRTYHVKGRIIRIPKNYNPATKLYATTGPGTTGGTWDGSFVWGYSNNPAWVYYDMLTNTRFGLGKRLNVDTNGYSLLIDRFALYVIGQYCDGLVPSGVGSTVVGDSVIGGVGMDGKPYAQLGVPQAPVEPRFTFNGVFNTLQDAYKVLMQLSTAFRGMTYWAQSQVIATQDSPGSVQFIVNNANVKNGRFTYQGSSRAQRQTVVTVGWNDPAENFKQKFEYVQDLTAVKQWGVRQSNIVLFGCTSRGQARRAGLWTLYTNKTETDLIAFTAGMDMVYILPGMLGEISDQHKAGIRWGGRTLAGTTTTSLVMDAAVTLTSGPYTLKVKMPDGTLAQSSVSIATTGSFTTLALSSALPATPLVGAIWALSSSTLSSRMVRVVSRTMDGPDSFTFTCVAHNPSKFGAIENGLALASYSFSALTTTVTSAVQNLVAIENSYRPSVGQPTKVTAVISWDMVTDPLQMGYIVELQSKSSGKYDYKSGLITDHAYTFTDVGVDDYTVKIVAVNQLGKQGPVTSTTLTVSGIDTIPPADVTGFTATQDNISGVTLNWALVADFISAYEVRVGTTWLSGVVIYKGPNNRVVIGPIPAVATKYWVAAIDTSNNYSVNPAQLTVTPSVPGAATMARTTASTSETIFWNPPSSLFAIDHYVLSYGATYAGSSIVSPGIKGTSINLSLTYTGSRTYWLVAVDTAGNVGTPSSMVATVTVPAAPTVTQTFKGTDEVLSWNVPASTIPVASYTISTGATFATSTLVAKSVTNSLIRNVDYVGNRVYWVVATDQAGNLGTPASFTTLVVGANAPTIAWSLVSVNENLTWTDTQNSLPIVAYEVRYGSTWAGGTVIGQIANAALTRRVDYGGARTYWIAGIDTAGNYGTPGSVGAAVTIPGDVQGKRADVVDNNALLYWTLPVTGSLPIDRYEVRKGATWAGGTVVGSNAASTFTTVFEQQSGNYLYWITAFDSAGNQGSASSISATINQPPDYILRVDYNSTFTGTLTNMMVTPSNMGTGLLAPVDTTATWTTHFTGQGITTPQQQVTAGNVLYINPSLTTASYDETLDYGTVLAASTVVININTTVLQGTVGMSCQIQVKQLVTDPWTSAPSGATSYLATNFRYVRVVLTFTATAGANLIQLTALEIKLSSKRISDGGSGTITNATTGLTVSFTRPFVQADTPNVQPAGTSPLYAVVDYTSVPNPTSFIVYLYNTSGTKVTGSFSWTAGGF